MDFPASRDFGVDSIKNNNNKTACKVPVSASKLLSVH